MNALLTMSGFAFQLISFPYVQRVLLPDGTGKVSMATSLIAYFSMLAQLGIPTYGIRACARVRDDRAQLTRTVHELLGINLAMDAVAYGLLAVALAVIPRLAEERLLYVIVSATILLNSIGMEWLYRALEQYRYITVRSVAFKLVALGAVFLLVREERDYVIYGGISIFASSASNLMNLVHARKFVDVRRPDGCDWKRHLRPVAIFFAMSCAATVYTNLDTLMLGFLTTDADVGFYNAAVKVKTVLVSAVTSLGAVLLPRSSYYAERGRTDALREISAKALRFVLVCAAGVMVYFALFAEECVLTLSGEAYGASVLPMRIIMPTVLLIGLTNILGMQVLVPLGKEKIVLYSELAGAGVNLVLNALLIPAWRSSGAAVGTLVAEAVVLAVQYRVLRNEIGAFFRSYRWGRLLCALAVGTLAGLWVRWIGMKPLATLVFSSVLFFGGYGLFLKWRREELITETWNRLRKKIASLRGGSHESGNEE